MAGASKPVVIITGVSGGIGLEAAKLFAKHGWIVVGTVRNRARTADLRGLQYDLQIADMLRPRDLERVVQTAWKTYGRLDALVCNAGYGLVGPIDTLEYAQMSDQLAVNTLAPAELIRQAVPLMRGQGFGAIVGVSSVAGRVGLAGYSMYNASKFALEGMLEALSMELAPSHVRVKLVEPSKVNTGFWPGLKRGKGGKPGVAGSAAAGSTPANTVREKTYDSGRGLTAEAVAKAIFRAATDMSSRLRYPVGSTRYVGYAQRLLPERLWMRLMMRIVTGK